MKNTERIKDFYTSLLNHYGPQKWWPAENELECILGAILTQNTSWKNAEKAIINLKKSGCMSLETLKKISLERLSYLIKPSGFYNQKATRIKDIVHFILKNYEGSLKKMKSENGDSLRQKLLSINGIGPETADSILLYAFEKPFFVVDRYTYRLLRRHRLIHDDIHYSEIQDLFTSSLEKKTKLFNEYHALIVKLGKEHCRKKPHCSGCPLEYDPHET